MGTEEKPTAEWVAWNAEENEKKAKAALYTKALVALSAEHRRWESNLTVFRGWDLNRRMKWIADIERAAKLELPMAEELMTRALAIRMGGA